MSENNTENSLEAISIDDLSDSFEGGSNCFSSLGHGSCPGCLGTWACLT